MIEPPVTDTLEHAVIHGVGHRGLSVTTRDGRPARLAIIDDDGNIIEAGDAVAAETWAVARAVIRNILIGQGYLKIHTSPTGIITMPPGQKARAA